MPLASVVILTRNGEQTLGECLRSLFFQTFTDFETILIDSGSTDRTIDIAKAFPVRILRINSGDFHHAKTRNLAISLCQGKYVIFLTQDAYAFNSTWLEKLLRPFNNAQVAATYSRQIPRRETNPVERAFLVKTYPQSCKIGRSWVLGRDDPGNFVVLSDVSSAYRRELVRFDSSLDWCEDQEMGLRLIRSGYEVVYAPDSVVCHSHNCSFVELFKRYRAVGKATSRFSRKGFSPFKSLRYVVELFASTFSFLVSDSKTETKFLWILFSLGYNATRVSAFLVGYLRLSRPRL